MDDISSAFSIEYEKLKSLNRWITSNEIPNDKEYSFLIPVDIEYLNQKISSFDVDKVKDFIESKISSSIDIKVKNLISKRTIILNNLPALIADSSDEMESIIKTLSLIHI